MKRQFKVMFTMGILLVGVIVLAGCEASPTKQQSIEKSLETTKAEKFDPTALSGGAKTLAEKNAEKQAGQNNNKENNNLNKTEKMNTNENIDMSLAQTCQEAILKTNLGDITIKFDGEKAPATVANFCTLAKKNFYNGIKFHRVIDGFMIQTGDPKSKDDAQKDVWGTGDAGYKFKDELPKAGEYKLGSVAMANSGPNTNGSQFFIVSGQSGVGLPPLYSLFGEVTKGMDVVEKIQKVETEEKGIKDRPVKPVVIEKVELKLK